MSAGYRRVPPSKGTCPDTNARPGASRTGTYEARGVGVGGSSMPSSKRRSSITALAPREGGCLHPPTGGSAGELVGAEQAAALELVQPAPDAVRVPAAQGVLEAGLTHGAWGAGYLGRGLAGVLLLAPLEVVGGEGQGGVRAAAGGVGLP